MMSVLDITYVLLVIFCSYPTIVHSANFTFFFVVVANEVDTFCSSAAYSLDIYIFDKL